MKVLLVALVVLPLVSANFNVFKSLMRKTRAGSACMSDPCNGNGDCCDDSWCSTDPKGYMCFCYSDWAGDRCDRENPCKSDPCLNEGWCCSDSYCATENPTDGYKCYCSHGYTGKTCDTLGYCVQNPDVCNGGHCCDDEYCASADKPYECYCDYGKSGDNCEKECPIAMCQDKFWNELYSYPSNYPDWKPQVPYDTCLQLVEDTSTCMVDSADKYCDCDQWSLQEAFNWDDQKQIYIDEYCDKSTSCKDSQVQSCVDSYYLASMSMTYTFEGARLTEEGKPAAEEAVQCLKANKDKDKTGCSYNATLFDHANTLSIYLENLLEDCDLQYLAEGCYHFDFDEILCGESDVVKKDFEACVLSRVNDLDDGACPSVPREEEEFSSFIDNLLGEQRGEYCEGMDYLNSCENNDKKGMSAFKRTMISKKMKEEKLAKQRRTSQLQSLIKLLKRRKIH